jgi:hypothetical protein
MALNTAVWFVNGSSLVEQDRVVLDSERRLEEWIAADLSLLRGKRKITAARLGRRLAIQGFAFLEEAVPQRLPAVTDGLAVHHPRDSHDVKLVERGLSRTRSVQRLSRLSR